MAERFTWDGKALETLFTSIDGPVGKMLKKKGIQVQRAAKQHASGRPGPNVQTGRLRSSISEELVHDGDELVERIGTDVDYAPYVELGTSRAPAYPFLRPALDAAKGP